MMGTLFAYAWRAWRRMERDSDLEPLLLGLGGPLLGAMPGGLVDHYFFNLDFPHSVSIFWLYTAVTVVTIRISQKVGAKPEEVEATEKVPGQELSV